MHISDQDINYIMNLSRGEKAEKRIKEFLNSFEENRFNKDRRIEFFNAGYQAFFMYYFKKFAGKDTKDCVLEAYVEALDRLKNNASLEMALECGLKAGSKYLSQRG